VHGDHPARHLDVPDRAVPVRGGLHPRGLPLPTGPTDRNRRVHAVRRGDLPHPSGGAHEPGFQLPRDPGAAGLGAGVRARGQAARASPRLRCHCGWGTSEAALGATVSEARLL